MKNYVTLLTLVSIVFSMAATARGSWISGGAPPPSSIAAFGDLLDEDYAQGLTPADVLMDNDSSSADASSKTDVSSNADASTIVDNFMAQAKDVIAEAPSSDLITQGKSLFAAEGSSSGLKTQGKSLAVAEGHSADGPTAGGDVISDLITQGKEAVAGDGPKFAVQGKIYCDPCRIQFPTKISYPLPNTKIVLTCHKQDSTEETYRVEGVSNEKGRYLLTAIGDHADEVCELMVSESPDPNCPEIMDDENHVRVSLTNKNGAMGDARFANPLGFMVKEADLRCKNVLDELGFTGI